MLNILLALALVLLLIGGAILAAALKIPLFSGPFPEPILASAVLPLLAEVPSQRPDAAPSGWG